jgi:phage gp36-like protein
MKSLVILAADMMAARAKELLHELSAEPANCSTDTADSVNALRDAIRVYIDARINSELTESLDILLARVDDLLKQRAILRRQNWRWRGRL